MYEQNATIAQGHYWFPQQTPSTDTRDSFFIMYYWADRQVWRYDEIFVYDAEFDKKHAGAETYEGSNMINGVFTNVNLASNTLLPTTPDGGAKTCIGIGGQTFQTAEDALNSSIAEYIGIATFPEGYMQIGTVFDAYVVAKRWPTGAPVIYFVDRTPGGQNYGYLTVWLILQSPVGPNYFWDYSHPLKQGQVAVDNFKVDPTYYFGLPATFVDGCMCVSPGVPCGYFGVTVPSAGNESA